MNTRTKLSTLIFFRALAISATIAGCKTIEHHPDSVAASDFSRVFVVVMENQDYAKVIGNPSMPFLNSLADKHGLATNYFGNTHPSIGNYFWLTTGQVISNKTKFNGVVTDNNLARQFILSNTTWGVYAEGLPSRGYLGDDSGRYVKRHNPFVYFSDVISNPTQALNIRPYEKAEFAELLRKNSLPRFVYLLPNQQSNTHDCPPTHPVNCTVDEKLSYGDQWLEANLTPILNDSEFKKNGLLILTFDEATESDKEHGGGKVATIIVNSRKKQPFRLNNFYQHQNLLRLICDVLNLRDCPGAASDARGMSEFLD